MHAGHAGHVLVEQDNIEIVAQVSFCAQQRQGLFAGWHGADVQPPGAALLDQHLATGVVVVDHQNPRALERAVQISGRLLQSFRIQRQTQPQRAALIGAALDAELAVHQQDQLPGNDQPQVTADLAGRQEVLAMQLGVQQRVPFLGRQRRAAVLYGDAQSWLATARVEGDDQQDLALVGLL